MIFKKTLLVSLSLFFVFSGCSNVENNQTVDTKKINTNIPENHQEIDPPKEPVIEPTSVDNQENNVVIDNEFRPNFTTMGPPTIIYKTRNSYYDLVPVELSADKTKISSYPDINDIYSGEGFSYPSKLDRGYLLDNRGIYQDSAFLKITYEEYSNLPEAPSSTELFGMILDDNPFTEIYDCGNRYEFQKKNEIDELNFAINSDQLFKCKNLKSSETY